MSSARPTTNTSPALTMTPMAGPGVVRRVVHPCPTSRAAMATPAAVASTIATPPNRGVDRLLHRSGEGCVTAPTRSASARAAGVNIRAASSDTPTIPKTANTRLINTEYPLPGDGRHVALRVVRRTPQKGPAPHD